MTNLGNGILKLHLCFNNTDNLSYTLAHYAMLQNSQNNYVL